MSNFNHDKNVRIESLDNQKVIPRYNLRKRKLISTTKYETQQSSDKTTSWPLIIDENTPVSIEDVNQVVNQFIEYFNDRTSKKKEEIEKLINIILNKLPMLKNVTETDLFLFRREKQILLLMKQFSFIILYYLLNIYWPHISELTSSRRFKAFHSLMKLLVKNNVMLKLTQVVDSNDIWFSYVITGVLYLITDRNLSLSHKDVISFTNVIENPIELVDTTGPNFIQFFNLLNHIVQIKFVINCYHKLLKVEKSGITRTQVKHCLNLIIDQLKHHLYRGNLPPNYSALTCLNCQIILNGTSYCLFHRMQDMMNCKWDLEFDTDEQMQYWAALLIIILHEMSHIIRRVEIPLANNMMSATTPEKLLNGKFIKVAGNQLEILVFGNVVKSVGDFDSIFLLKSTSWNASTIEEFHKQLKDHTKQDILQQPNNDESHRLRIPGKCGDFDLSNDNNQQYGNRINIGNCATSIWQPHSNLSFKDLSYLNCSD